jgi:hypothetical protein
MMVASTRLASCKANAARKFEKSSKNQENKNNQQIAKLPHYLTAGKPIRRTKHANLRQANDLDNGDMEPGKYISSSDWGRF